MRSMRLAATTCLLWFLSSGFLACARPGWMTDVAARFAPEVTYAVPVAEPLVALTIDDGPDPESTAAILDVLEAHRAQATFFVIGDRVRGNEDLLARMHTDAHEVGNHSFHERASIRLAPETLAAELQRTHALLAPYGHVRWFRPGSGFFNREMVEIAADQGYRLALGSLYPLDPVISSSRFHAWYILRHIEPGAVIVLHDSNGRGQRTATTLRVILPELQSRGYRVVTLSELEAARNGAR